MSATVSVTCGLSTQMNTASHFRSWNFIIYLKVLNVLTCVVPVLLFLLARRFQMTVGYLQLASWSLTRRYGLLLGMPFITGC